MSRSLASPKTVLLIKPQTEVSNSQTLHLYRARICCLVKGKIN